MRVRRHGRRLEREIVGRERAAPEPGEVVDDVGANLLVLQVAVVLLLLLIRELEVEQRQRIRLHLLARRRTALEAVLERADPVERRAVGSAREYVDAKLTVLHGHHRGQAGLDVAVAELQIRRLAAGDVCRPRSREAVGLLLLVDHRLGRQHADPGLDRVTEFVREHDADGTVAEGLRQGGDQIEVVVGHVVAVAAVERVALGDVLLVGTPAAAVGDGGGALGIAGPDPAREVGERLAVDLRKCGPPIVLDVGERCLQEVVVGLRRLVVTEVDDRVVGVRHNAARRRCRYAGVGKRDDRCGRIV